MNKKSIILVCALLLGVCITTKAQNDMTNEQKASYALGASNGEQFKNIGLKLDPDMYMKGLKDGLAGQNLLTPEQIVAATELLKNPNAREPGVPKTPEARIVSFGMDNLPKEERERILFLLQAMYVNNPSLFKKEASDET